MPCESSNSRPTAPSGAKSAADDGSSSCTPAPSPRERSRPSMAAHTRRSAAAECAAATRSRSRAVGSSQSHALARAARSSCRALPSPELSAAATAGAVGEPAAGAAAGDAAEMPLEARVNSDTRRCGSASARGDVTSASGASSAAMLQACSHWYCGGGSQLDSPVVVLKKYLSPSSVWCSSHSEAPTADMLRSGGCWTAAGSAIGVGCDCVNGVREGAISSFWETSAATPCRAHWPAGHRRPDEACLCCRWWWVGVKNFKRRQHGARWPSARLGARVDRADRGVDRLGVGRACVGGPYGLRT